MEDRNDEKLVNNHIENHKTEIRLPELDFNSDDELEEAEEVEAIIFHPAFDQETQSTDKAVKAPSDAKPALHQPPTDIEKEQVHKNDVTKPYNFVDKLEEEKTKVPDIRATLTEIELDNALIDKPSAVNSSQDTPSLGDSGSSDSSLLGKLENCMKTLKEDSSTMDIRDEHISTTPKMGNNNSTSISNIDTVKLDLRSPLKFPLHKGVAKRYGTSNSSETDFDDDHLQQRWEIKQKSLDILKSKGKSTNDEAENDISMEDNTINDLKANTPTLVISRNHLSPTRSSSSMVKCVDSMLENVNKIIYQISDPGENVKGDLVHRNGEVKRLYDSFDDDVVDDKEEYVQEYIVFDETTGKPTSILKPEERRVELNSILDLEKLESETLENPLSIDTDICTQVVGWDKYLDINVQAEQELNNVISPMKKMNQCGNVFDSLFTNSFLSASMTQTLPPEKSVSNKPKRNILKTKKSTSVNANDLGISQDKKVTFEFKGTSTTTLEKEKVLKEVADFKEEIKIEISKSKDSFQPFVRELNFLDQERETKQISTGNQANLVCLACMQTEKGETPLKHDESICEKYKLNMKTGKAVCSTGVSTDDLERTYITDCKNPEQSMNPAPPPTKGAKKKKKKKKTSSTKVDSSTEAPTKEIQKTEEDSSAPAMKAAPSNLLNNVISTEQNQQLEKEFANLIKELEELTKRKVLLHNDISFNSAYRSIPPGINKELLLLKVPLESPGVLKNSANNENRKTSFDEAACGNYIGLVTLFIFLLHSNALKYQYASPEVPFDVVSIFQCYMDNELLLVFGVCENEKSYKQKSKKTKLGSYFFHAVSNFMNNNTLEQLLQRIAPTHSQLREKSIPGHGKLSSFINIMPDGSALTKLLTTKQSLVMQNNTKSLKNLSDVSLNSFLIPENSEQELTCITLENVNTMVPRMIAAVLKNLYTQSLEIVGLRLGYVPQVNNPNIVRSVLAICIQDSKVASSEQGHLLFGKNPELKDLNINYHSMDEQKQSIMTPILRYTINSNRAIKQVVQWFGPHFEDLKELKEVISNFKSELKNDTNSNNSKRKKWTVDNPPKMSFLCNFPTHAVLLVSSAVPSWFLPHIISGAKRKGVQLEVICKNVVSAEVLHSLGVPENSTQFFGYTPPMWKKASRGAKEIGSFIFLVLRGNSSIVRLNNLMDNFSMYLDRGESPSAIHQTFENSQNLRKLLREHRGYRGMKYERSDCFAVLPLNEQTAQLGVPYQLMSTPQLHDLRAQIMDTCSIPSISLAALVIYGDSLLAQTSTLLRLAFFGQTELNSESLVGIKLLKDLNPQDAHELSTEEHNTKSWKHQVQILTGKSVLLLIVKTVDFLRTSQLRTAISSFLLSSKVDMDVNGILVHSDAMYIFDLMLMYFHPNELYHDNKVDSNLVSPAYLEETHPFLTSIDKLYELNVSDMVLVKKTVFDCKSFTGKEGSSKGAVYRIHPQTFNFPWEILLRQQISYTGISVQYNGENFLSIVKAISRIIRLGFRIVAWRFPVYESNFYWLNIVFSRADALYFMTKVMNEIETSFPSLIFKVRRSVDDLVTFVRENFCAPSSGGIFHVTYTTLLNQINFIKDQLIDSRDARSIEWHPLNMAIGRHFNRNRTSFSTTLGDSTREVSVLILTAPLLAGHFAGKSFPRSCIFPEVLQTFESINYQCLAARMTSLDAEITEKILGVYGVQDEKKRHLMKTYMTNPFEPFMVVLLLGVCIQSNFWMEIEKIHSEEEDVAILKKFMLTTSSKRQVEFLVPAFFDQVLPNSKIDVHTSMSEFALKESKLPV